MDSPEYTRFSSLSERSRPPTREAVLNAILFAGVLSLAAAQGFGASRADADTVPIVESETGVVDALSEPHYRQATEDEIFLVKPIYFKMDLVNLGTEQRLEESLLYVEVAVLSKTEIDSNEEQYVVVPIDSEGEEGKFLALGEQLFLRQ